MRIIRWLTFLPFLLLLSGCAVPDSSATCEATFNEGKTVERECLYNVTAEAERVELAFSARLTSGTLRWALIDAKGTTIDFGTVTPEQPLKYGKVFQSPESGDWKLILHLTTGRGELSVRWKGY